MANFNKVMLMGNLTRDPEVRYPSGAGREGGGGREGGSAICKFGLAVNRQWRNQAGEKQEETCFVDIVAFGRTAEVCGEFLSKGRPVFIDGRLHYDSWDDKESGKKRSKLEVVAENVQFLGSREGSGGGGGSSQGGARRDDQGSARRDDQGARAPDRDAPAPSASPAPSRGAKGSDGGEINFDDIPF